jgi:hypothetical protein
MNAQDILLQAIRKHGKPVSINDDIASVLNISYDAAHRRVSGKSKFSIEETALLANHYNLSLDALFMKSEKVIVEKTIEITNLEDMLQYFAQSAERLKKLTDYPNATLYYSAKDIPIFYFMEGTILSKFKAYAWLSLLNTELPPVAFENFIIDESFMEHTNKFRKIYESVDVKEIWSDTTISSTLQQILYYYEAGLLNFKSARAIYNDMKRILDNIREKCNKPKFSMYYNELLLLNNNVLVEAGGKQTLFVPYTLLGYFVTDNGESCNNVSAFFNQQIQNSVPLSQSGIRDRNQFFNKAIRKVDYYMDKLNNQVDFQP